MVETNGTKDIETYTDQDVKRENFKENVSRIKAKVIEKVHDFEEKMKAKAAHNQQLRAKKQEAYSKEREHQMILNERHKAKLEARRERSKLDDKYKPRKTQGFSSSGGGFGSLGFSGASKPMSIGGFGKSKPVGVGGFSSKPMRIGGFGGASRPMRIGALAESKRRWG